MSTPTIAVVAVLIGLYVLAAVWLWRRERRRALVRDRIIAAAHARAEAARQVNGLELLSSLPSYDPAWNAGLERLWDAIRDNREGEQP